MRPYTLSPRLSAPTSVPAMMTDVVVALLPALATGVYLFGLVILANTLVSIGFCLVFHRFYGIFIGRTRSYSDPSPWVTGLLLAFCFPSDLPFWVIPLGAFFSIIVVKELFGGFACNFINPALAGWIFIHSAPYLLGEYHQPRPLVEANLVDAISSATPMSYLQQGLIPPLSPGEMFLGFHSGAVGEVSTLMLGLGGCYLLLRQVIRPMIPLSYLGTVALLTYLFPLNGQDPYYWMVSHLFSGGLMLGAFFMATDPVTSPVTPRGTLLYGMGCGILTVLLRYYGSYPEGVAFAILTMNSLVWWLDKLGMPRTFGMKPFTRVKRIMAVCGHGFSSFKLSKGENTEKSSEEKEKTPSKEVFLALGGYGLTLVLVVLGISACHSLTSLSTHQAKETHSLSLLHSAMPNATFMSEIPYQGADFDAIYYAYAEQEAIGYCVKLSTPGFQGEISLLVGIDFGGAVTGIAVLSQNETIHSGDVVLSQVELSRFRGKSGTLSLEGDNAVDGISGATITLKAVITAVNTALELVQELDGSGGIPLDAPWIGGESDD